MKYKAVIFDLDGTILDTLEDLATATNYALRAHKLPEHSKDEVRMFVGNGIRKLMERAVPQGSSEELIQQVHKTFTAYYTVHCADATKPYPGINELLQKLRSRGYKTAVVSNKADYAVQELAKQYFAGGMDAALGESSSIPKKPAPDMVLAVLKKLQVQPEEAVYVGDSDVDVATARNSGLDCIGVEWGFRGREFLLAHGAKVLVSKPEEILELV